MIILVQQRKDKKVRWGTFSVYLKCEIVQNKRKEEREREREREGGGGGGGEK